MKCNIDRLTCAAPMSIAAAAIQQLSNTQGRTPEQQAMASAVVFIQVCEHLQIPPNDLMTWAKNIQRYQGTRRPEFRALTQFIKEQL